MDPPAGSVFKAKRRKVKHEEAPGRIPPSTNVPCDICKRIAIDHRSLMGQSIAGDMSRLQVNNKDIDFHLEDELPDLPALQTSFENGCQMCGELRVSLTRHPSFQSFAKLRFSSQSALKIELRASLQCASDSRAGSLTFRADLVSGAAVSDHKASPQLIYEVSTDTETIPVYCSLLSTETLSPYNASLIRSWIDDCQRNHANCPRKLWSPLPTRVIDVQESDPVLVVRSGKQGQYAALSHCWGLSEDNPYDQQYITNSETIGSRLQGMPMAELPKTFQDAVIVTRGLGLRYLWIDSLCILQDSVVEMQQEIQKMASVYGNATVTISATSADNGTSGFLAREPRPVPVVTLPFTQPLSGSLNLYRRDTQRTWDMDVENSEWNRRAWTFQERILSSRVLHFAKNKLYFECCSGDTDEDRSPSRRPIYDHTFAGDTTLLARFLGYFQYFSRQGVLELDQVYKAYYELAAIYSKRELTFHQDREAAFSAIAYQFQALLMSENIGGLWADDGFYGLLWTRKQDKWWKNEAHSIAGEKGREPLARDSLLPSWSWYSTRGEISWPKRPSIFSPKEACYKLDNLIRYLEPSQTSPGRLQVLAYITSGYHEYDSIYKRGKISVNGKYFCYPDFDSFQAARKSGSIWMLRFPSPILDGHTFDHGLLLELNEENEYFKRVGTFQLGLLMSRSPNGNWVKMPAPQELKWITLV